MSPSQLLVHAAKAGNSVVQLPHDTSLLEVRAALPEAFEIVQLGTMRVVALPIALGAVSDSFFSRSPVDARIALESCNDISAVSEKLLRGGKSVVAGRLVGAFTAVGRAAAAQQITAAMRAAGHAIRLQDPFDPHPDWQPSRADLNPAAARIRVIWEQLRGQVLQAGIPAPTLLGVDPSQYVQTLDEAYTADAYHSLSIEGYRVSPQLIGASPTQRLEPHRR